MGLFDFIRKLTGKDHDLRISKISNRIFELERETAAIDKELKKMQSLRPSDVLCYKVSMPTFLGPNIKIFSPLQYRKSKSMADLLQKRKEAEDRRIRELKNKISLVFLDLSSMIRRERVIEADDILFQVAPLIKEVNDVSITKEFHSFFSNIAEIKERKRIREEERIAREKKEKEEHDRRLIEEKKLAERKAERNRLEREKKAKEYEEKLARQERERIEELIRLKQVVTRKKDNAEIFINHLNSKGVTCFYHFTDGQNLNSIRRLGGLFSWFYCKTHGINIPNAGGDNWSRQLDCSQGLQDYVRLSFCDDHPMAYRFHCDHKNSEIYLLEVKIDVASFVDTQFSNVNAAAGNNRHGKSLEDLQRVNIMATKLSFVSRDQGEIFHEHQAECMVKTFIPIEYITNIYHPRRIY